MWSTIGTTLVAAQIALIAAAKTGALPALVHIPMPF